MKETTQPPKDPKKKLWIGYAVILSIVILSNIFLFPALMQASVKSVNYSTFLQMLEDKELSTVQIEDQQIYFVDKNENSYKTNAIAQDNNLVARLEDAGVEFGTVYQSPTIWDSLLNLVISFLPMILLFWFVNRWASKKMQEMGGAGGNAMLFGGGKSGAKQYVVDDETGIKFNDVAGEDEAKESLQESIWRSVSGLTLSITGSLYGHSALLSPLHRFKLLNFSIVNLAIFTFPQIYNFFFSSTSVFSCPCRVYRIQMSWSASTEIFSAWADRSRKAAYCSRISRV